MKRVSCKKMRRNKTSNTSTHAKAILAVSSRRELCQKEAEESLLHDICVSCEYFVLLLRVRGRSSVHQRSQAMTPTRRHNKVTHARTQSFLFDIFADHTKRVNFNLIPNVLTECEAPAGLCLLLSSVAAILQHSSPLTSYHTLQK
jgi:hypothetical protein